MPEAINIPQESLAELYDNLQEQLSGYRRLNTWEEEKKQILIANDAEALDIIVAQEERLIHELNALEKQRQILTVSWRRDKEDEDTAEITLQDLALLFPHFAQLREELTREIESLQELNTLNAHLLENLLAYNEFTLQTLTGEIKPLYTNPAVKQPGGNKQPAVRSYIDTSI